MLRTVVTVTKRFSISAESKEALAQAVAKVKKEACKDADNYELFGLTLYGSYSITPCKRAVRRKNSKYRWMASAISPGEITRCVKGKTKAATLKAGIKLLTAQPHGYVHTCADRVELRRINRNGLSKVVKTVYYKDLPLEQLEWRKDV